MGADIQQAYVLQLCQAYLLWGCCASLACFHSHTFCFLVGLGGEVSHLLTCHLLQLLEEHSDWQHRHCYVCTKEGAGLRQRLSLTCTRAHTAHKQGAN